MTAVAFAIAAFCAACERPEETGAPPAPPASEPIAPVSDFAVTGQDVTFLFGRGHLRIPDGWQPLAKSRHPLEVEIESVRHRKSPDTWAICRLTKVSVPNVTLASQDTLNRYIETLWDSIIAGYKADGIDVAVDYPVVANGIRAKSLKFTSGDTDMFIYGVAVPSGPIMHSTMISCDGSSPMGAEDRADITALVTSFRYEQP